MFNKVINGEEYICRLSRLYDKISGSKFWLPLSILSIIIGFILFFFLVIPLFMMLSISLTSTFFHFLPAYMSLGLLEIAPLFFVMCGCLYLNISKYDNIPERYEITDMFVINYVVIFIAVIIAILFLCYNRDGISYIH